MITVRAIKRNSHDKFCQDKDLQINKLSYAKDQHVPDFCSPEPRAHVVTL